MVGRRAFGTKDSNPHEDSWGKDIETGLKKRPRFKDAVELAMAQRTTHQLKKQLNEGIDGSDYKKYRKSDEEACETAPLTKPKLTLARSRPSNRKRLESTTNT